MAPLSSPPRWTAAAMVLAGTGLTMAHPTSQAALMPLLAVAMAGAWRARRAGLSWRRVVVHLLPGRARPVLGALLMWFVVVLLGALATTADGAFQDALRARDWLLLFLAVPAAAAAGRRGAWALLGGLALGLAVNVGVSAVQFGAGLTPLADALHIRGAARRITHPSMPGHLAGMGLFYQRITMSIVALAIGAASVGLLAAPAVQTRWRIAGGFTAAAGLASTVLAGSRITMALWLPLVLLAVATARGTLPSRRRVLGGLALTAVLTAGGLALPGVQARLSSALSVAANGDRAFIWRRAVERTVDAPVFGVGYGRYPRTLSAAYKAADPTRARHDHAHHMPLSLLVETGLAGLLFAMLLLVRALRAVWRGRRDPLARAYALGWLAVMGTCVVHDPLFNTDLTFLTAVLLGTSLALHTRASSSPHAPAS